MFRWIAAGCLIAAPLATPALSDGHETIIETHAYTNFGAPKYGPDAERLDYVNPDAPKGGEISLWTQATFDSFNGYTRKGVEESTVRTLIPERILQATADDAYAAYCYLCTTMEYPESRDWVIFNLRDDVTFSDGSAAHRRGHGKFSFDLYARAGPARVSLPLCARLCRQRSKCWTRIASSSPSPSGGSAPRGDWLSRAASRPGPRNLV